MKKARTKKRVRFLSFSGFTLIELLVSITILSLVGIVVTQVFFTAVRTNTKTEIAKDVKQNGDLALEIMARMIRGAESITSTCSGGGSTTTALTLINPDENTTTFGCYNDGSVLRIASTSGSKRDYLTNTNVSLFPVASCPSSLSFVCTTVSGVYTAVEIEFDVSQKGSPPAQSEKARASFRTSVMMRNE